MKILFVCLGNICRSPTAQGVFEKLLHQHNLHQKVIADSAGTSGWHVGSPPDNRAIQMASKKDYNISNYRGRQVDFGDFYEFDLILAADYSNYDNLIYIAPEEAKDKIKLLLEYGSSGLKEIPDPYYGGEKGFEEVLNLIEEACENIIEKIKSGELKSENLS